MKKGIFFDMLPVQASKLEPPILWAWGLVENCSDCSSDKLTASLGVYQSHDDMFIQAHAPWKSYTKQGGIRANGCSRSPLKNIENVK